MIFNILLLLSTILVSVFPKNDQAFIGFEIKNAGLSVDGYFEQFEYQAHSSFIDNPSKAYIRGEISVASINTGIAKRDRDLLKKSYFDEEKFPKIKFQSTKIKKLSSTSVEITGTVNIKGKEKELRTTWYFVENEEGFTGWKSEIPLKRSDFGVGGKSWILSDDLTAYIRIKKEKA